MPAGNARPNTGPTAFASVPTSIATMQISIDHPGGPSDRPGATVDLTNCDREPIHIPGAVQPHGVLIVLREPDLTVTQVSRTSAAVLSQPPESLLGRPVEQVLAAADLAPLRRALTDGSLSARPLYLLTVHTPAGLAFDAIAHRHDGLVLIELEPSGRHDAYSAPQLYQAVQGAIRRVESAPTLLTMGAAVADEVRRISGFDRVMVYRFDDEWNGSVVAEAKRDDLEPFLGLHYPASDIPVQARELYARNRLRFIPDRDYVASPLVPPANPLTDRPLDMSYAVLRSVSPVHVEYLRNMGVRASMSISLLKDGKLWGLIACHHYAGPRYVTHDVRTACELVGDVMSLQVAYKADAEVAAYAATMVAVRQALAARMTDAVEVSVALTGDAPNLLDLVQAGGAAIVQGSRVATVGDTPAAADLIELARWLSERADDDHEVWHTAALPLRDPRFDPISATAAGVLAASLIKGRPHYLMWFRPERIRSVNWAGDPAKSVVKGDDGVRLSPAGRSPCGRRPSTATPSPGPPPRSAPPSTCAATWWAQRSAGPSGSPSCTRSCAPATPSSGRPPTCSARARNGCGWRPRRGRSASGTGTSPPAASPYPRSTTARPGLPRATSAGRSTPSSRPFTPRTARASPMRSTSPAPATGRSPSSTGCTRRRSPTAGWSGAAGSPTTPPARPSASWAWPST